MGRFAFRKLTFWFAAILVLLACELPVLSQPAAPSSAPGSIETIVFQTAAAAQTQTAFLRPPATNSPIPTLPPTGTPTETPTATATVIFILPTSTPPFEPYDAGSDCRVLALEPHNPILAPRTSFDTTWTLQNTGDDLWLDRNIDFRHSSGTDMHQTDVYDLPSSVPPDGQIMITVPMIAPRNPGTYTSTWLLATNRNTLCRVSVTITVK